MSSRVKVQSDIRAKMVSSGGRFEEIVAMWAKSSIDSLVLLNRCFMSYEIGRPIETDVVLVTNNKIYCLECKNYKRSISGAKFSKSWNFIGVRKGVTQNPYILNKKRIRMIRALFIQNNLPVPDVENIIVIPNSCKQYTDYPKVLRVDELLAYLTYENSMRRAPSINKSEIYKFLMKNSSTRNID